MPFLHGTTTSNRHRLTVYQLLASVNAPDGRENALHRVVGIVLPHIAKALYQRPPDEAEQYKSFEYETGKGRCECVALTERLLWAVRFRFSDRDGIQWFYDIAMIEENSELLFGLKIETSSGIQLADAQEKIPLAGELLSQTGLLQSRPVAGTPWNIDDPAEIDDFYHLLTSPNRSLPVIVISAVNWRNWNFTPTAPTYLVNADYLAPRVRGYAHVVCLSFRAAFAWSDRVGKSWSVYDGACRTYFPNPNFEHGLPAHHPSNWKEKIWYWVYGDQRGPNAYTSFLIDTARHIASTNRTNWNGLYFVPDARILAAELELARAAHLANAPERENALKHHVDALRMKLDAAEEENNDWLAELEKAQEAAEFYKQENVSLRLQIDALRAHLARQSGETADADVPIPDNYDNLPEWVRTHLAGRLILLPRAERAVGKAEYSEPEMVYRALLILANEYRDSRMGVGNDDTFRAALAKYGMDFSGSIDKSRAGQEGEAYYVNYPLGSTNREMLKFHLERGNSREPRYCMRIYFFWDEDTNQVVIGWLPGHLNNRAT